jgi:hypothetical protein
MADEKKFVTAKQQQSVITNNAGTTSNTTTTSSVKTNHIAQPSTVFNDGWTSTAFNDYISMAKSGTELRLIFPDPAIDDKRPQNTSVFEPHYWDNVVLKYYRARGQVLNREKPAYSYNEYDIWMAPATDITSGKNGYLAMILSPNNNGITVITVFAPSKEYIDANFAKTADFNRMFGYNKFNATANDLIGEWKNSTGSGIEYYNVYTGNSAGMATAHVSDQFVFGSNGAYSSEHSGTSTFMGALSHGKSNYNGTYTLHNGTLNMTGREGSDSGEFTCYFEAVKMGFVLRLTNKQSPGINMVLYRVN